MKRRRHLWGLAAAALMVGAGLALIWATKAHPAADLLGYAYPGDGEGAMSRHELIVAVLVMLATGGLFGVVAWLADVQSAQMSPMGRRRPKRHKTGDGAR